LELAIGGDVVELDSGQPWNGVTEYVLESVFKVVCNPWECKYFHCFSGGEVEWSYIIDADNVIIVFMGNEDSIEVFYLSPEHLLSKIRARVN